MALLDRGDVSGAAPRPRPDPGPDQGPAVERGVERRGAPPAEPAGALAHLVEEARRKRVDLRRVPLAALFEAALAALAEIGPLTTRADGIGLAAELAHLKSATLLPPPATEDDGEADRLRRRILDRALVGRAADALEDLARRGPLRRGRGEAEAADGRAADGSAAAEALDLLALVRAYAALRLRAEPDPPLALRRILAMSVREAMPLVRAAADAGGGGWVALFGAIGPPARRGAEPAGPRSVAAAGFVAALEMARRGEVEIRETGDGGVDVRRL